MGTGNATQRIIHGQVITVDGDHGMVELRAAQHRAANPTRHRPAVRAAIASAGVIALVILIRWRQHRHRLLHLAVGKRASNAAQLPATRSPRC
jgi:hypothetical protein